MDTFRFIKFKVYTDAKNFYRQVLCLLPRLKNSAIRDQLNRAALSVVLNIAEGSAKRSDAEFAHFLEISIASLNESVSCIDILFDEKEINPIEFELFMNNSEELAKQLGGFIRKLRAKNVFVPS